MNDNQALAAFRQVSELIPDSGLDGYVPVFIGQDPILLTRFRIGEGAAAVIGACAAAAAGIWEKKTGRKQDISIDVKRAAISLRSFQFLRVDGRPFTRVQGDVPTMDLYRAKNNRWIHLHGAFPHLRDGTLQILGCENDRRSIASAVASWDAFALEDRLAEGGQCGAVVRNENEWSVHPQGHAVSQEPLLIIEKMGDSPPTPFPLGDRPLSGIRVLDLTRVLAGPVCARTLSEHGAEVLNVTSKNLPYIDPFVVDTGHGKRNTFLNLLTREGKRSLMNLLPQADVFSQGYRPGKIAALGFSPKVLAERRPGIIYVSINCYGHTGPWKNRPGWEQMAQSVVGVALKQGTDTTPKVIAAAPSDYITGHLAALGVMVALQRRAEEGGSYLIKASLCRTTAWLRDLGLTSAMPNRSIRQKDVNSNLVERETHWGVLGHLPPVAHMSETHPRWVLPPAPLGAHPPMWIT